jgi:anti-anti-sigma factor
MNYVEIFVIAGLVYTVIAYSIDLMFSLLGVLSIRSQRKKYKFGQMDRARFPSLNILIPCFNEEKSIQKGIRFLQEIDYPNLKIIIINDGSRDRTLDILRQKLSVSEIPLQYQAHIPTQTVRRMYRGSDSRFLVVDKVNGGKADTLNTGINLSDSELVCCVDADTLIKADALKKVVMPFLADRRVVASGGSVRIKNDSEQLSFFPNRLQSPYKLISTLQVIEYIRSINVARNSLSLLNANLIISGAFGVFKTGILREIGGYEKFSKGEDLELLTRIHFHMLKQKKRYRIAQVYQADSFTNAPESFRELKSQRKRWQVGLVSTLRTHFFKFFRYPLASITFFSMPYYILFEIISPIVQLFIILAIPILTLLKLIPLHYLLLLLISMIYNSVINVFFLLLDFSFSSYYDTADKLKLISTSLVEPFFYHQLNCYWKLLGTIEYMKKVFVRAAWTPPRGDREYKSQLGKMSVLLNPESEKGLEMVADYKSLYRDQIVIIALSGSFESSDIVEFQNLVDYFRKKKRKRIILELKELENISSDALSMMIQLCNKLKREKGGLVVLNPQRKIEDEFKISNVIKEIKICKNYSNAIKEVKYG